MWRKPKEATFIGGGARRNWKTIDSYFDGSKGYELLSNPRFQVQKYIGPLPRSPYRIITTDSNLIIAVAEDLNHLVSECWTYLNETLPMIIPQDMTSIEWTEWIVQHVTTLELNIRKGLIGSAEQPNFFPITTTPRTSMYKPTLELEDDLTDDDYVLVPKKEDTTWKRNSTPSEITSSKAEKETPIQMSKSQDFKPKSEVQSSIQPSPSTQSLPSLSSEKKSIQDDTSSVSSSELPRLGTPVIKFLEQEKSMSEPATPSKNSLKYRLSNWRNSPKVTKKPVSSSDTTRGPDKPADEEEEHQPHTILSIESAKSFIAELFDEDADRETRTLKYSIMICIFLVLYSLLIRYCSLDLFLVVITAVCVGAVKVVVDRKKMIVFLLKRKMKKVGNQKKKQWFGWMTPTWLREEVQEIQQSQSSEK